jgi:hypothetical protein
LRLFFLQFIREKLIFRFHGDFNAETARFSLGHVVFTIKNPGIPAKDVGNEYTHHQINVVDILFSFSRNYAIKASEARNACHGAIFAMKHRMRSLPVKGVPSFAH